MLAHRVGWPCSPASSSSVLADSGPSAVSLPPPPPPPPPPAPPALPPPPFSASMPLRMKGGMKPRPLVPAQRPELHYSSSVLVVEGTALHSLTSHRHWRLHSAACNFNTGKWADSSTLTTIPRCHQGKRPILSTSRLPSSDALHAADFIEKANIIASGAMHM